MVTTAAMVLLGGTFTLSAFSSLAVRLLQSAADAKGEGLGFTFADYAKETAPVEWSPLHDPIVINPCVCPTF